MTKPISFYDLSKISADERAGLLDRTEADLTPFLEKVAPIIEAVRTEGDAALARFANDFDGSPVTADAIAASEAEFDEAFDQVDDEMIEVLEFSCDNVRRFHEAQMPEQMWMHEMHPGCFAGEKVVPIASVACYVPRGKGAFPSVTIMTTVPAVVAGVEKTCIVTPPGPDGKIDAATLVAARLAGVEHVYKCGGAQAVAAVAYGTETVPRCPKIVGPGSPWVVAAKRLLADRLDPGPPAGPSEAIVLTDDTANPGVVALDLLNESEHGDDSSVFLVTDSRELAEATIAAIPTYWDQMGDQRVEFSSAVLCGDSGGIVLAPDMNAAIEFVNDYAPEHLLIHGKNAFDHLSGIRNAGEVLLGEHTPLSIANYTLGPNAVLPTGAAAMTRSPLSVFDYLKLMGIGHMTAKGYDKLAPYAYKFARYEGFDAHANAVSPLRTEAFKKGQ